MLKASFKFWRCGSHLLSPSVLWQKQLSCTALQAYAVQVGFHSQSRSQDLRVRDESLDRGWPIHLNYHDYQADLCPPIHQLA